MEDQRELVELSHPVTEGMITYPGLPGPRITPHRTREQTRQAYGGASEFAIDRIDLVGNTGTYLDSPFHRFPDGTDLADLPLTSFADLDAVVVPAVERSGRGIGVVSLTGREVAGRAVLLHTGGDRDFGLPAYAHDAPFLTADAAAWLVRHGAALVGIDAVNIDDVDDLSRPAHTTLLAAGVPVVEHLTGLDRLPPTGARFTAAPVRVRGFGTFPVRAFASIPRPDPGNEGERYPGR